MPLQKLSRVQAKNWNDAAKDRRMQNVIKTTRGGAEWSCKLMKKTHTHTHKIWSSNNQEKCLKSMQNDVTASDIAHLRQQFHK